MPELKIDYRDIDPAQLRTYQAIAEVAKDKAVPFIIVGASARDLVMHHGYGMPIKRATRDIDFAIQVPDWDAFEQIYAGLIDKGYQATRHKHRLLDQRNLPLDIIPFGPIETKNGTIEWPPDGTTRMEVLGFQEALDHADRIIVDHSPPLHLAVASPVGLLLLKLVSWSERDPDLRRKDARDIVYLLKHFESIPDVQDSLYGTCVDALEHYEWDTRLAGAYVAGLQLKEIAHPNTLAFVQALINESADKIANDARAQEHERGVLNALVSGLQAFGSMDEV